MKLKEALQIRAKELLSEPQALNAINVVQICMPSLISFICALAQVFGMPLARVHLSFAVVALMPFLDDTKARSDLLRNRGVSRVCYGILAY